MKLFSRKLNWLRIFIDGDCQYLIVLVLWQYRNVFHDPWERLVVLSSDLLWVFCLPNSTESEKNFYVYSWPKSVRECAELSIGRDVITKGRVWGPSNGAYGALVRIYFTIVNWESTCKEKAVGGAVWGRGGRANAYTTAWAGVLRSLKGTFFFLIDKTFQLST